MTPTPILWHLPQTTPVIAPGQLHPGFDDARAGAGQVIQIGDRYRIYYWGSGPEGHVILAAETPVARPNDWQPIEGVMLRQQPETRHNCNGPSFPFVLRDGDGWRMFISTFGPAYRIPTASAAWLVTTVCSGHACLRDRMVISALVKQALLTIINALTRR